MSTEEPAWKAELERDLIIRGWLIDQPMDLMPIVEPHILAAEQRGREVGLREARELALDHARSIESQIGVEGARGVRGLAYLLGKLLRTDTGSP